MQESGTSASPCLSRCSANPSRGPARRVEIRLPATSRTQLVCRPREDPMELRGVGTRQCHLNCCLVSHFPVPGPGRRALPDQARVVRPALGSITGRHTAWDAREHGRALPPMETQSPLLMNNGSKWPRWPRPCHESKRGERRGFDRLHRKASASAAVRAAGSHSHIRNGEAPRRASRVADPGVVPALRRTPTAGSNTA